MVNKTDKLPICAATAILYAYSAVDGTKISAVINIIHATAAGV